MLVAIASCGGEGDVETVGADTSSAYSVEGMSSELVDGVWVHHRPSDDSLGAVYTGPLTASPTGCLTLEDGTAVVWNSTQLDDARAHAKRVAAGETPSVEIGGGHLGVGTVIPVEDLTPEFIEHCMPTESLWLN